MFKKKWIALGLVALSSLSLLSACGANKTADNGSNKTHLNAAIYWSENTLDPATEYDGWTTSRIGVTETLVTIDKDLELAPLLADDWKQEDETTWVFHIRDGVTFHNGKTVDAEAVKLSFERAMTVQERAKTAAKIKEIKADGQELTIITEEPFAALLANLTEPLYSVTDVTSDKDLLTNPIGTGPFKVTSFTPEKEIKTERYKDYWNGASTIETMTIKTITDDTTRSMALQSGEIDIAQRVNSNDLATLASKDGYNVFETQGTRIRILLLNQKNHHLSDLNVRRALANAIDYASLVKIMGESFTLAGAPFPLESPYAANKDKVQTYNLEQSKAYLSEAGYQDANNDGIVEKDGKALELRLAYDDSSMNGAMEAIQAMASKIGISIKLEFQDSTSDIDNTRDFDLLVRSWQSLSTGDPQWMLENMFKTSSESNISSYSNPNVDAIIERLTTAGQIEERISLTKEAEDLILDDVAHIFLFGQNNYIISNAKVKEVTAYPIDYYFIDNKLSVE